MAEQCLCFRARWVARALTRLYDEVLRPLDLQATQLTLLNAISVLGRLDDDRGARAEAAGAPDVAHGPDADDAPGVPMTRLSEVLGLTAATLSRNLRLLERDGLIRIRPAPEDARVRLVSLTREGERRVADAFPLWNQAQERVAAALGPELAAALLNDFEAVMAADPLDPGHADRDVETTNLVEA